MNIITIAVSGISALIGLIVFYFITVFLLFRLIVPHMGFIKGKLPDKVPLELVEAVEGMKKQAKDDYDYLWRTYNYVTGKYDGQAKGSGFNRAFWSLEKIWPVHDYAPDNQQNFILRIMLVKSGFFKDENIQVKYVSLNWYIHQYLIIKTSKGLIEVDPASDFRGIPFNKHAEGFK
ncbi:Uncharacterised protein [uncultured archaeon]|nr:Uncharacterised protein [uncultured archaeon]